MAEAAALSPTERAIAKALARALVHEIRRAEDQSASEKGAA